MQEKHRTMEILPNETTQLSKNYLYSYGKGRTSVEELIEGLQKIVKENPAYKYLVHLLLYMHIDDPNVEEIFENDEIPFQFIPYNYVGISKELYCKLVIQLELHNQFLQMVSVMKAKKFFQNLMITVVNELFSKDNIELASKSEPHLGAPVELWRSYLINIAKNSKDKDANINSIYTDIFKSLLKLFLDSNVSKQEKLSMILRITGIVCMKKADYDSNTEISELNRDWAYDNTENLAKKSRETFNILYPKKYFQSGEEPISKSVLNVVIDLLVNSDTFLMNDEDKSKWSTIYRTANMSWLSYVGGCAYLTQMILVKYTEEIGENANALTNAISNLIAFKPKMAAEDFHGDIEDFDQFCDLLSVFGERERYQRKWFEEFLTFPEALIASKGVQIAVKLVSVAADFDIALGLVNKALELDASKLNEKIKCMVINMLSANKNVRPRKQEFVTEVFKNGIHSLFVKEEFVMDFNMLCTKLGTIESENDPKMLCYWEDIIYSICFQNPLIAAEGILKQTIRINQFKALLIAKPFLAFETEELFGDKLKDVPIFQTCLFNIIHATEDYDPLFDHMVQAVPALIQKDFIDFWTFHEFLIQLMGNVIIKRKINKLFKLVLMYEQLLEYGIKENKFAGNSSLCVNFLDSLRIFTYAQAKSGALSVMIKIRDKVYELKELISDTVQKGLSPAAEFELTPELEKEYGMISIVEFGALYARNKLYRKSIKAFFQDPDNFTLITFSQLLKAVVSLVFNSSNSEWEAVIEYFLLVLESRPELIKLNPLYVINESLYFALSESKKDIVLFQRYLDFYSFFVKKLQNSTKLMAPLEQKSTIDCLAGVSVAMYENSKAKKDSKLCDTNILRHILLMMLSLIDWMVVNNDDFDEIKKDLLIMVSSMRMPQSGPCIPIQRSIISRIVQKRDAPLITINFTQNDPTLSEKMFKNYVSMKFNQVPEEMQQLEKDWDSRDTFEYNPPTASNSSPSSANI